ncbi:receptor-like protein EIX2 [Zingiber officinale]|uniref:receptor-like protein EIX2 n=1 Tax=Zingiber officinale TaxID=94328 RepID=UPI001C4D0F87|nr:receptor-like protein EIX2 [Zingiber officinale]
MATAWSRSRLGLRESWPLHHPQQYFCYYLPPVWLIISLAFFFLMEVSGVETRVLMSSKGCLERERDALLLFKAAIKDPSARLSSWRAQMDCCAWTGVVCHNRTGSVRVAELNLGNPNEGTNWRGYRLRGELLHPSLLSLKHLQSLNLSGNDFEATQIPTLVGSLHPLRYLDLSYTNYSGTIPPHLGNLTNLRLLYLSPYYNSAKIVVHSLDWLSGLSSLKFLDMSFLDLSAASHNWVSAINMLPSLQQLILYDCSLSNIIPLPLNSHLNLTSLLTLNLGRNNFNSSFPNWLFNLTSLSSLQLDYSGIRGALPNELGNLISLTYLDLSWNLLHGPLPDGLMNLSSLSTLKLKNCSLSGPIPIEIGKLSNLNVLDLSFNSFKGEVTELHLSNLTKLVVLSLIENPVLTIPVKHTWTPPFQLLSISLGNCKLGPEFPAWLRSQQSLTEIMLCDTSIEGNLPEWVWNSFSNITFLDLSNNKITGTLPASLESLNKLSTLSLGSNLLEGPIHHLPPSIHFLDLSFNAFSGPLPPTLFMPQLNVIFLSHNHINGSIPSNVCNSHTLEYLGLSNNKISGEIPQCWQEGSFLKYIHLGNNMLSGEIPSSLGNLTRLQFLHLNNNNLKGDLPSSLQDCKQLAIVDLGNNKISGNIPSWIGQSWQQLRILQLRSNMFDGNIDPKLGYLKDLQIIDLANNNLSGPIPNKANGGCADMLKEETTQIIVQPRLALRPFVVDVSGHVLFGSQRCLP